jgi:hypothetical protein
MVRGGGGSAIPSLVSSQAIADVPSCAHGSAASCLRTLSTSDSVSASVRLATVLGARLRELAQPSSVGT